MQTITIDFLKDFIKSNTIPFKATQQRLCIPIISRMCQKMLHGIMFDDIKICEGIIIDGHHRYLSALIMKVQLGQVPGSATSATEEFEWHLIEFDEEDWDTSAKIEYLNALDAKYNSLDIQFVNQITLGKQ